VSALDAGQQRDHAARALRCDRVAHLLEVKLAHLVLRGLVHELVAVERDHAQVATLGLSAAAALVAAVAARARAGRRERDRHRRRLARGRVEVGAERAHAQLPAGRVLLAPLARALEPVPAVAHRVVRAARQQRREHAPLAAKALDRLGDDLVFGARPRRGLLPSAPAQRIAVGAVAIDGPLLILRERMDARAQAASVSGGPRGVGVGARTRAHLVAVVLGFPGEVGALATILARGTLPHVVIVLLRALRKGAPVEPRRRGGQARRPLFVRRRAEVDEAADVVAELVTVVVESVVDVVGKRALDRLDRGRAIWTHARRSAARAVRAEQRQQAAVRGRPAEAAAGKARRQRGAVQDVATVCGVQRRVGLGQRSARALA
jgi:hypothetical protein